MTATITAGPIASRSANVERSLGLGFAHLSNDVAFSRRAISPIGTANCQNIFRVVIPGGESIAPCVVVGLLTLEQSIAGDQNLPLYYPIPRRVPLPAYLSTATEVVREWSAGPLQVQERNALPVSDLFPVVREFAEGVGGICPERSVVAMAVRLVQAAIAHTDKPEITVDDDDGMEFDLRLGNGWLLMANLFPDGKIDVSVYDDSQGIPVKRVERMPQASEAELVSLFRM